MKTMNDLFKNILKRSFVESDFFVFEKKNFPKIDVLIPAFKCEDFLEECLDSVYNQSFKCNRILLGIDGCEHTLKKAKSIAYKYDNLEIYFSKINQGTYSTLNFLFSLVDSDDYVQCFGADDVMNEDMIEKMSRNSYPAISKYHGTIYIKKEIYDILGGFRNWKCAADTEFLTRLKFLTNVIEEDQYFKYRKHSDQLTKKKDTCFGSRLRSSYTKIIDETRVDDFKKLFVFPEYRKMKRIKVSDEDVSNDFSFSLEERKPMNSVRTCIFNQFFGLGDILFIEPLMRKFFIHGFKIVLPVIPSFLDLDVYFPYINFVDKRYLKINYDEKRIIDDSKTIIFPMRWSKEFFGNSDIYTMKNKYKMLGEDVMEWKKMTWYRHRWKEKELMKKLGINDGEKYNLINENFYTFGTKKREIKVNNDFKNVNMGFVDGYTMLDWASVIENASSIHSVNTSIIYLLDTLNLSTDDLHLYSRNDNGIDWKKTDYLLEKNYILHN